MICFAQELGVKSINFHPILKVGIATAKAIKVDCALVNKGHQNLSALAPAPSIMVFDSISELVNTVLAGE